MKVGIPKERRPGEARVAASPDTVKRYRGQGLDVVVERGAGRGAAIGDDAFEKAGATLGSAEEALGADIVLKVQRPEDDEAERMKEGQVLVTQLDPYNNRPLLDKLAEKKVTSFSLELLPRTTRAQAMDVLSSQANLAGYKAVIDAMARYTRVMPMMMTAAGTVTPAKFFIVGAGVAGLQAIATARRMGAVVSATDVRPAAKEEVESLGAKFVGVPVDPGEGGYARALTEDEQKAQAKMVAEHVKNQDIVVTTAQIPGRKAPRIVSGEMVRSMKAGSVVLDLAADSGGNVEGSKPGEVVETEGGVSIIGASNLPARLAPAASTLYAKNLMNFVALLVDKDKGLTVNKDDDLVVGALVTEGGAIVHPRLKA
ncbi:MAG: Re/Si-specific NAD(P)(+) transhydrogenase subunit alpha [Geminicoccaceae bacterium]|nr:Re/Si-specific NAD(P)(+) transhydrogenase subunit alpha [Geminicoccaceae bacterium]